MHKFLNTGEELYFRRVLSISIKFPKIVCLCGSTRFKDQFQKSNLEETLKGNIVLSVGSFIYSDEELKITEEQKIALDILHKRKIDLCDEIFVLNVGKYIGESTKSEISYAKNHDKYIRYLEPVSSNDGK